MNNTTLKYLNKVFQNNVLETSKVEPLVNEEKIMYSNANCCSSEIEFFRYVMHCCLFMLTVRSSQTILTPLLTGA